ncbi:hypothetical protein BC943DRAFT_275451 [Umbelopsis sp. AD052]|nr:hypothetical protein BC943DRAFT_275451 [Umbelopsis sp. AD052]
MSQEDIEKAETDETARPRKQRIRYPGDSYTPKWVRYLGQAKEGYCDSCQPGKWLQLKNSAYWYHKQFFHGISSVSGRQFMEPIDQRWGDQDAIEGLCHQCRNWISICTAKRKNSVLWYRHAHKVRNHLQCVSNIFVQAATSNAHPSLSSSSVISIISQKPHSLRDALLYSFNCPFQFCEHPFTNFL